MKTIKYWHVKLFQHIHPITIVSGCSLRSMLLHEGYAKQPFNLPHRDGFITLLTDPDGVEVKLIRADAIDSATCTPVYENECDADEDENSHLPTGYEEAARPLIKWLAENVHPHHSVIVDSTHAELLEGQKLLSTDEYLRD